jgi:hypothetical protein
VLELLGLLLASTFLPSRERSLGCRTIRPLEHHLQRVTPGAALLTIGWVVLCGGKRCARVCRNPARVAHPSGR